MSGELSHTLKRNRQEQTPSPTLVNNKIISCESPNHEEPSTSNANSLLKISQKPYENENIPKKQKTINYDTPDSSSSESESNDQSHILLEALQKIFELENELEYLVNEENDTNNESDGDGDAEVSQISANFDAEALGFAMCARETLLFLQKEGISENSLLYQALKDKLVGTDGIPI